MKKIYLTLIIILFLSYLRSNPLNGYVVGAASSIGIISGETFTSIPVGGTFILITPFGFKLGSFSFNASLSLGMYKGNREYLFWDDMIIIEEYNPKLVGFGGNIILANIMFVENHVGLVGEGTGFRGFTGISLKKVMEEQLNLPFNLLVGYESFFSTDMIGTGNASYWGSISLRTDYTIGRNVKYDSKPIGPPMPLINKVKNIQDVGISSSKVVGNIFKKPFDRINKSTNDKINIVRKEIPKVNATINKKDESRKYLKIFVSKSNTIPMILDNNITPITFDTNVESFELE